MIDKIGRAALFAKSHFKTAVNSAKELKGKTIYKARGLKKKVATKHAKLASDIGLYKGSFAKDFAAGARTEGRLLRKNVFTGNNAFKTVMNYPITTGVGLGITARAVLPKKEKKNKKKV
tara:strand:+ start:960 stop:1316 length:357 start_codon:yes stop_codon:yes gene_type:complete